MTGLAVAALGGCSTEQLYGTGQVWQRTECNRLADADQRARCLSDTATSYAQYRYQRAAALGEGSTP